MNKHFSCNSETSHLYVGVYEAKLWTYTLRLMKSTAGTHNLVQTFKRRIVFMCNVIQLELL